MTGFSGRDTPQGRRYEVKIALAESMFLILGCIGLALSFPPLVYISAAGYLVTWFLISVVKAAWVVIACAVIAVVGGLLAAGVYSVQVLYYDNPPAAVTSMLQNDWLHMLAIATVVAGIIINLFAYPGTLDQLREHLDGR